MLGWDVKMPDGLSPFQAAMPVVPQPPVVTHMPNNMEEAYLSHQPFYCRTPQGAMGYNPPYQQGGKGKGRGAPAQEPVDVPLFEKVPQSMMINGV